ncbi:MAG: DUF6658 family protein [Potamolinea sp.]
MNKIIVWLNSIRLDRILTAFLVGILMFVSTACSGGASAKTADQIRQEVPSGAVTSEYKGGMNDYSDVDPRQNTAGAQAKAKALIDNAQKNINQKSVDSVDQYVENYRSGAPLGERVRKIGENVGDSAKNLKEDVAKGSKENFENLQDVTKDLGYKAKDTAEKTANVSQFKVKEDIRKTTYAADKAADASEDLGDKIKQAASDVAKSVKSTFNKADEAID